VTTPAADITQLLSSMQDGDESAADRLLPLVYDELRRIADGYLRRETPGHTLQATALVHEAYLRLVDQRDAQWRDRIQFLAVAAQMIRRILVDHARAKRAAKRGGDHGRFTLHESIDLVDANAEPVDLLDLHHALEELTKQNERQGRVVELRYFGGLNVDATAHVLDVSPRTVKDDWRFARAWLRARLQAGDTA
jgi:RNA polymerase sigma-70 factor (ECF subfamily)